MKIVWSFCLLLFSIALYSQTMTVSDFISARKILTEEEILASIEKKDVKIQLNEIDWAMLRKAGFSEHFLDKLRESGLKNTLQKQDNESSVNHPQYYKITISVRPENAGKVLCTPSPDADGKILCGTELKIHPQPNQSYLFKQWEGDIVGHYPLKLKIRKNLNIVAVFQQPYHESIPPKIEDPAEFKDTRMADHIYDGTVFGAIEGQGINKNWGMEAEVDYKYTYHVHYVSSVTANDGYRIKEKRHFDSVQEMLFLSKYRLNLDLKEEFIAVKEFMKIVEKGLKTTGSILILTPYPGARGIGKILSLAGEMINAGTFLTEEGLNQVQKIRFSQEQIESAFRILGKKNLEKFQNMLSNPNLGAVFGYPPNMKMLEGKTFDLEYEDGIGLIKVDVSDSNQIITSHEKELIQRAFYLSDYYIFRDSDNPKRKINVGDTWNVDAKTIAGVLDPRLKHQAQGNIKLYRDKNQNSDTALFFLKSGKVQMVPIEKGKKIQGEFDFTKGQIFYDLPKQYVKEAYLSGTAKYHEFSIDHLFFGTRFSTQPNITIRYECKCEKK